MPEIKVTTTPNCFPKGSADSKEIFLLEFQGKFETKGSVSLSGMEVGKLDTSGVNLKLNY